MPGQLYDLWTYKVPEFLSQAVLTQEFWDLKVHKS